MQYGFIIDNRKCIGCHACTVACKSEHDMPIGVNRTWVKYIEKGDFPHARRLFTVLRCNHCEDAPCVDICPVTALYTRDDGIVDFDNRRCIGCKACMQACPYDALFIDPNSHTAAKCNYCAHRVDIGLRPACVVVCPEQAIVCGDMDNPLAEISQLLAREQVTARKTEKGTRPNLFYIDGDESALKPALTQQSRDYMWSSQTTGVGHFVRYAEERIARSEPEKMAGQLSSSPSDGGAWVGDEQNSNAVWVPEGRKDLKMLDKAKAVLQETARRVYDAPVKGVLWGWEVSAYVWTKAIATGMVLLVFFAHALGLAPVSESLQWTGMTTGLFFLLLTGALLVKDLDRPSRFAYVLLRPQWTSWLVRGGYAITFYAGDLLLWGVAKAFNLPVLATLALWGSAVLAVITAVYTAFLFGQAKGRDFWQSPMLPLHMLGHAFMAGAAVFVLFDLFMQTSGAWQQFVRVALVGSLVLNVLVLLFELTTTHPTADAQKTVHMIVSGRFRISFWLLVVLAGNALPFALLLMGGAEAGALAGGLALFGIYMTEYIWVKAPQLIPLG